MADPFLLAHRAEPLLFDISGRAPISIRDQILRGHYLIRALHRTGGVGPGVRLLIVGAGAAGASAAIEAVKRGVQTVLVEAKPGPFLLQASCSTRWIDPAQYDFVAPHWAGQAWPASGPSGNTPLAFRADWAASIAKAWENTLTSVALAKPNLLSGLPATIASCLPSALRSRRDPGRGSCLRSRGYSACDASAPLRLLT